ncbi:hypothetical protein MGG_07668 [Pyricularia oryzae 70-15]|uniref:Uncharacterized protein n=3 Tax=Pyricularia oryzae TaxID=318829 RepID=G4N3C2_PYRO7|nr:uncharacterized protein MGG_07668 [Pyricularia oryzae 70-15]EHA51800.1 hypothetical protein MGG_07668 [Pyricularia oryzae 70-15]ELQ39816.1 hypothetical protein OOU_Y34scaffold00480g13 [Pyricularia oryzae Y34]
MAPFYFFPNYMPGCEACFECAGCGGCRVVKANGEATFLCQPCRDTMANIIFLCPDAAAANALVNNGFCQFCFCKPSAGICCNDCAVRTPEELEFVARKGTILVLLANALQQPGAREQMLEPILPADDAVLGAAEEPHFDPAVAAREWQNMPGDIDFGFYPDQDFQFGNNAQVPGADANVPKPEPVDAANGIGHHNMPIPSPRANLPVDPVLPQIVVSRPAQGEQVEDSGNATPTTTAGISLAARILGLSPERAGSLDPQPAQKPSGRKSTDKKTTKK